jgi:hypothetical protein
MKRNVMNEWKTALSQETGARRGAWAHVIQLQRSELQRSRTAEAVGGTHRPWPMLQSTRPLRASDTPLGKRDDVARAVLILQRNNKLLEARFGVGWPAAASVVCGEAARRNMSVASLARVLTAGLRRDARRGGDR